MSKPESHIEPIANGFPSKELLRRYLSGELSPEERADLEQYLTDEEGMLKDALEGLQLIEDKAQFDRALGHIQQATRARLRERHARRRLQSKRRNRVQPKVRDIMPYLISAAAAVALLIVSVFIFQEYRGGSATESSTPPLAQNQPSARSQPPEFSPDPDVKAMPAPSEPASEATAKEPGTPAPLASAQGRSQQPGSAEKRRELAEAEAAAGKSRAERQQRAEARAREELADRRQEQVAIQASPEEFSDEQAVYEAPAEPAPKATAAASAPPVANQPTDSPATALKQKDSLGQGGETLDEVVVTARQPQRTQNATNSVSLEEVQVGSKKSPADSYEASLKAAINTDDPMAEAEARWNLAQYYLQEGKTGKAKRQLKKLAKEENAFQQRAAQLLEEL